MMRGLWRLIWLEIKIFLREPLGAIGAIAMPVTLFLLFGRMGGGRSGFRAGLPAFLGQDLAVFASIFTALGAVTSLVAIIAIYRESGILKRLRATPLTPATILTAHVVVKLLFSAATLVVLATLGRRLTPPGVDPPLVSFTVAVLFSTACLLTIGFVVASLVRTARFAQGVSALVFYPMLGLSGMFVPVEILPPTLQVVAKALPLTYAISLQRGIWRGDGWLAHGGDVVALLVVAAIAIAVTNRVFRWE